MIINGGIFEKIMGITLLLSSCMILSLPIWIYFAVEKQNIREHKCHEAGGVILENSRMIGKNQTTSYVCIDPSVIIKVK